MEVSGDILFKTSGAAGNIRLFRRTLRELEATNHLPDYVVELVDDSVVFTHRDQLPALGNRSHRIPLVDEEGMHDARTAAPGNDIHALYQEWGDWWVESGCPDLNTFIGFCKRKAQQKALR